RGRDSERKGAGRILRRRCPPACGLRRASRGGGGGRPRPPFSGGGSEMERDLQPDPVGRGGRTSFKKEVYYQKHRCGDRRGEAEDRSFRRKDEEQHRPSIRAETGRCEYQGDDE